jgi:transcriptional regulator with XRE-family HTH domain
MDGPTLRAERRRRGLTQAELASALGVAANTVARWERGEMPTPGPMLDLAMRAIERPRRRKSCHNPATVSRKSL